VILWAAVVFFKLPGLYRPFKAHQETRRQAVLIPDHCLGMLFIEKFLLVIHIMPDIQLIQ